MLLLYPGELYRLLGASSLMGVHYLSPNGVDTTFYLMGVHYLSPNGVDTTFYLMGITHTLSTFHLFGGLHYLSSNKRGVVVLNYLSSNGRGVTLPFI